MPVVMVPTIDVPDSVIDKLNNEVRRAPSDLDGNDEKMVDFLDEAYKKSISNEIRERRQEKKQRDQEALVISQDVTKIPEVTDMLTSEQDEQDLPQSYEAINATKLTCNLENREDSLRSESLIAKLDKNIIMEQELKQQLSSPAHTLSSDQILKQDSSSSDTAQNIACMFRKAIKVGQEVILYWCYFIEKYDKMIDNFIADGVKKKTATSMYIRNREN
ncbi:hypothetical protein RhiirA4_405114 [Rhizophagus irregularis]|uniref:Uncharacterized protein n=1 Tax=Rhizophagus irregularis TaxID=588596 RepID=A0A2I1GR48_9GLOM|nr:hypothetical protein RhiirA4_405114 [Rhizophagus irregularis]